MKRILFFLLLFHTSIKPEGITVATAVATTLFSTTAGSALASSVGHAIGVVTTFIAGWFIDKKIRKSRKKEPQQKPTLVAVQTPITKTKKQNNQLKKDVPCCDDWAKSSTIENCAKKKNTPKKSLSSPVTTQEESTLKNQPPEDDPCPPLKERRQKVKNWAEENDYKYIEEPKLRSKNMPVYKKRASNLYITVDRDCHGGSIMKMFERKNGQFKRIGSFSKDFRWLRK